jgi:tetratricopeptide (TPR) repeat protein
VARLLAALTKDAAWYEEATRRLLAAGASDDEQPSLWYELARTRLLRGDRSGAVQAFTSLSVPANWLGNVLKAYLAPLALTSETQIDRAVGVEGLKALAANQRSFATQRALQIVTALRALLQDELEPATSELETLHDADSADTVVATALAALHVSEQAEQKAAKVLASCALGSDDAKLAAQLQLQAGIHYYRSGERQAAIQSFRAAAQAFPQAGNAIIAWALRAAQPDDLDARRQALQVAEHPVDRAVSKIESFALEAGSGYLAEALSALDEFDEAAPKELRLAATLAKGLLPAEAGAATRLQSLARLENEVPDAAAVARALGYYALLEESATDAPSLEERAARWAELDKSVAAALEWVSAARRLGDGEREVAALEELASRLDGPVSRSVRSVANLVAWLYGSNPTPLMSDTDPVAILSNLELAGPGCDPRRRAAALGGIGNLLGSETSNVAAAVAGYNHLAAGDYANAEQCFRLVVTAYPEEVIGWEGLRAVAAWTANRRLLAEACAALGEAVSEASYGAELWEQAALILLDELNDPERGELALSRAVERDVHRFVAFDRLFRIVRARKDGPRLLTLIAQRLEVADDADEIAKLYWERARVLRESGDREGSLDALESVTMLEPDHVGALALSGEIYITTGQFEKAAQNLARLSELEDAPARQRLLSGVAACDLYENKLADTLKALDVLASLFRSGLSTLPVRERLARAAAKAQAWDQATEVLEQLMNERQTREGRVEAARFAMAIYRDRLRTPERALGAVDKIMAEAPADGEAIDLMLEGVFNVQASRRLLERARAQLVEYLSQNPLDIEQVDRLARTAEKLEDAPVRQTALGALVALGEGTPEIDRELSQLDQRVARLPRIAIDESALPDLADPADRGPIAELMKLLAPTYAETLGPGLSAFGVTKRDRVDPREGLPVRNEIAAWAGALGLGEFELYVGGQNSNAVYGIPSERPLLVIGKSVAAPLSPAHRQAVARELFAIRRGTSILRHREATDIAALVVATCKVAEIDLPSLPYAMLAEFERQLAKGMPRKLKKLVPDLALPLQSGGFDPIEWVRAATSSLDRMAAIAAGDVSWVLASGKETRGQLGASREAQKRAERLLSFVFSPAYLRLREQLGMGIR